MNDRGLKKPVNNTPIDLLIRKYEGYLKRLNAKSTYTDSDITVQGWLEAFIADLKDLKKDAATVFND